MKIGKIIEGFKYFESQESDENVVLLLRRHWLVLAEPLMLGGMIIIVIIAMGIGVNLSSVPLLGNSVKPFVQVMLSFLVLLTISGAYLGWLVRYLNLVILTDEHLVEIKQLGIFHRKVSQLDLDTIEDATASVKGALATIMHIGTVFVQTAGELPNFEFRGLEDPYAIQQKIMETKEIYMKVSTNFKPSPGEPKPVYPISNPNESSTQPSNVEKNPPPV